MREFNPIWYTIPEFADSTPVFVYHKEQEQVEIKNNGIQNLHVLARTDFFAEKGKKYLLRISADDYYKLYVNGTYVTQGPAPAYPEHYYYNSIDLTPYLAPGKNVIAVHLYYQGLVNRVWNSGDNRFGIGAEVVETDAETGKPGMRETVGANREIDMEIVPEKSGGERYHEMHWRYRISEAYTGEIIGYDTQFLEDFDSRKWDVDWNTLHCEEKGFKEMVPAVWADYHFAEQTTKQLAVYSVRPVLVEKRHAGAAVETEKESAVEDGISAETEKETAGQDGIFVDMGQELTGMLCIKAEGRSGSRVLIHCGEECDETGRVRYQMRCNCIYQEEWMLDEGENQLEQYDYKAFRYLWIVPDENVTVKDIWVNVRHYPMEEETCTLQCSDKNLEKIFTICKNAVKYGTQEGYLDCPTREKGQYLGDAVITAHAQVWLTGSTEMLRKCIRQFAETSGICPGLMGVAPGALMQEIGDFSLLWAELLLLDYQFTGDKEFLREYYPVAKNILKHFSGYAREDGLLEKVADKWNLVDWPEELRDGYDFTLSRPVVADGCHNVINALYIGAAKTLSEMERILGLPETCEWESLKAAFQKAFYREQTGVFADSEESSHSAVHSNVYALYFGLAPEGTEQRIADFLCDRGLCCGVFVSYFFLKALARVGRWEDMYWLLVNESEHGWVNMLREGATTCYEAWGKEQKWNTSLCHPWASAPIPLIIEELAGFLPGTPVVPGKENGELEEGGKTYVFAPRIPRTVTAFSLKIPYRGKRYLIKKEGDAIRLDEI